jgi:hypothetical protein
MFIYRLHDAPLDDRDIVFRTKGPGTAFAITTLFFLASLIWCIYALFLATAPRPFPCFASFVTAALGALTLFMRSQYLKSRKPTNWLLRYNGDRLLIKFRSYLNAHFSLNDPQIFSLEPEEIASIRSTRETRITIDMSNHAVKQTVTYLDIQITGTNTTVLEALLLAESQRPAPVQGRFIQSTSKYQDFPVELLPGNVLRLHWNNGSGHITPRIKEALRILGLRFRIETPQNLMNDFTAKAPVTDTEKEARIRELLTAGDEFAAVTLTRHFYKLSVQDARQKIESLSPLAPTAPPPTAPQ